MSWWLIILLGYLIVCWITWFVVVRAGRDQAESTDDGVESFYRQRPALYWLSTALTALVVGPFLPLFMARCLWSVGREYLFWRKFGRTYRETTPEPIHPANVPTPGQEHFERCTPVLLRMGFAAAGTYLLKPEPMSIHAQCLLSQAGETVVDIALIGDSTSVSFVSVLENGNVLETTCSAEPMSDEDLAEINQSGRFTAQMLKGSSETDELAHTYRSHLELLAGLEQRFDCGTLHLALDQVPAVKRYENAVFGEVLFAQGKVDNQPEPPQCPIGIAKRLSIAPHAAPTAVVLGSAVGAAVPVGPQAF